MQDKQLAQEKIEVRWRLTPQVLKFVQLLQKFQGKSGIPEEEFVDQLLMFAMSKILDTDKHGNE